MRRSRSCVNGLDLGNDGDASCGQRRNSEDPQRVQPLDKARRAQTATPRVPACVGPSACKPPSGPNIIRHQVQLGPQTLRHQGFDPDKASTVATSTNIQNSSNSNTLDDAPVTVLRTLDDDAPSTARTQCQSGVISSRSYKLVNNIYEECYPLSTGSALNSGNISIYHIKENACCRTIRDNGPSHAHSNGSLSVSRKTRLLSARQKSQESAVTRRPHATLQRTQSSLSRFSKISNPSGFRNSSDGMDTTDHSSEPEQEKEPKRPKTSTATTCRQVYTPNQVRHTATPNPTPRNTTPNPTRNSAIPYPNPTNTTSKPHRGNTTPNPYRGTTQLSACRDIDRETLDKVRRWMETLPKRFSGLSNVLSVPDPTPDYRD